MTDMLCTYRGNRDEAIVAYLYDDITADERAAFEAHVIACETCRDELAALRDVRAQLSQWAPATFAGGVGGRQSAVGSRKPEAESPKPEVSFWRDVPVWAQTLAATLVLGVAAGAANLNIHHDAGGFTVRTGWTASAASPASAAPDAPWRAELAKLESDLRAERASDTRAIAASVAVQPASPPVRAAASDAELLRQVKALIADSEKKEQNELALRIAQFARDNQAARTADLVKIDRMLGVLQNSAAFEVARNREMINSLTMRVSQNVR